MKTIVFLSLLTFLFPIALVDTACAFKGDEKNKRTRVVVDTKERGRLGVAVEDVTPKLARRKNLNVQEGVYVNDVETDSPADEAGIKEGDVIIEFNGKKVVDNSDLIDEVRKTKPGTEVTIGVLRDGEKRALKATIAKAREPRVYSFSTPSLPRAPIAPHISIVRGGGMYGLSLEELNKQLGEYFNAPNGKGVLVKNVKRSSEADKAGFKAGDVIVKVGKETIADIEDIHDALEEFKEGDKAEFEVLRKGTTQKLSLVVEEKPRRLSLREFGPDIDIDLDLLPPDEGVHFRHESEDWKQELRRMKDALHRQMIHLRDKIKYELNRIRLSVNV